jgi:hypothetical protein
MSHVYEKSTGMIVKKLFCGLPLIYLMLMIVGCSSSLTSPTARGQVRIILVDSPADFDQVNIVVTRSACGICGL